MVEGAGGWVGAVGEADGRLSLSVLPVLHLLTFRFSV